MERGALWRDNQQSTFAHTHTSSSHSTTSLWSPNPYPHCFFQHKQRRPVRVAAFRIFLPSALALADQPRRT